MFAKLLFWILTVVVCSQIANSQNLNLGDSCTIRDKPGVCKKYTECEAAKADTTNKIPPQRCSRGFPLIVCCSNDQPAISSRSSACPEHPESYLKIQKDGKGKARDKCIEWLDIIHRCVDGVSFPGMPVPKIRKDECNHSGAGFIVGGEKANLKEFPHQALLGYNPEPTALVWRCGGSLISDQWILTAAHCTWHRNLGYVTKVKLGILTVSDARPEKIYDVAQIEPHSKYIGTSNYNDIALLKLSKTVTFSQEVIPACVDFEGIEPAKAIATGWGITENGDSSDILMKVTTDDFPNAECRNIINSTKKLATGIEKDSQVCYGSRTSIKDTCQGDSGGPLQSINPKVHCTYIVFGVTSFGLGCGTENVPGVYTRVYNYLQWIESTVWP